MIFRSLGSPQADRQRRAPRRSPGTAPASRPSWTAARWTSTSSAPVRSRQMLEDLGVSNGKLRENPFEMDDLGVPHLMETPNFLLGKWMI